MQDLVRVFDSNLPLVLLTNPCNFQEFAPQRKKCRNQHFGPKLTKIGYARNAFFARRCPQMCSGFDFFSIWSELKFHGGLKWLKLDQPLPSNLLKTDFPLKLTIHKWQRKQQCFATLLSAMSADLALELTCFLFSFSSSLKKLVLLTWLKQVSLKWCFLSTFTNDCGISSVWTLLKLG